MSDARFRRSRGSRIQGSGSVSPRPHVSSEKGEATLSAWDALEELPLLGEESEALARGVALTPAAAAALRAALDWLLADRPRPLRLRADDSLFEVVCGSVASSGLRAAHEVLGAIGGNLGPALEIEPGDPLGAWSVRVPAQVQSPSFLMVEQGGLKLAIPWHGVLRVRMAPTRNFAAWAEHHQAPALAVPATTREGLRAAPAVLVAHGLKRAWFAADRLVWRLRAERSPIQFTPPLAALSHAVRTDKGEQYWVVALQTLLEGIDLPPLPERSHDRRTDSVLEPGDVTPIGAEIEAAATAPRDAGPAVAVGAPPNAETVATEPPVTADDVAMAIETPPVLESGATVPDAADPPSVKEPVAPAMGRALVAEDSISARIFLGRLFEQHAFRVTAVSSAAELSREILEGPWSLVCVDVDLGDRRGQSLLVEVRERLSATREPRPTLVALVRDADDLEAVKAAGISLWLRKPFDPESLRALLTKFRGSPK